MKDIENMAACMLSILDSLKLFDNDSLDLDHFQSFSEMMFRKMKAYNIDLNKELGFTHLKPSDNVNPLLKNHKEIREFLNSRLSDVEKQKIIKENIKRFEDSDRKFPDELFN